MVHGFIHMIILIKYIFNLYDFHIDFIIIWGNLFKYPNKTEDNYREYAELAEKVNEGITDQSKKRSIFGVYGEAPISKLISIPNQVPYDPMHLVFQGHAKWLLNAIFLDKNCDNYMGSL